MPLFQSLIGFAYIRIFSRRWRCIGIYSILVVHSYFKFIVLCLECTMIFVLIGFKLKFNYSVNRWRQNINLNIFWKKKFQKIYRNFFLFQMLSLCFQRYNLNEKSKIKKQFLEVKICNNWVINSITLKQKMFNRLKIFKTNV